MSVQNTETPFPVIDADPHFNRVLRYFRPSDYAAFAGLTVAAPAGFLAWRKCQHSMCLYIHLFAEEKRANFSLEKLNPVGGSGRNVRAQLGIMTVLGAFGGFLYAYQQSSCKLLSTRFYCMQTNVLLMWQHFCPQCDSWAGRKTLLKWKRISRN